HSVVETGVDPVTPRFSGGKGRIQRDGTVRDWALVTVQNWSGRSGTREKRGELFKVCGRSPTKLQLESGRKFIECSPC
uniref:hypothetical protein n=1 Tax=Gemmatimonas sp. TaxID=1962908 RepID=UPI0035656E2C